MHIISVSFVELMEMHTRSKENGGATQNTLGLHRHFFSNLFGVGLENIFKPTSAKINVTAFLNFEGLP